MHKLAIIAISGFAVSAVSLGAAIAVGAGNRGISGFDDVACPASNATATTRQFTWDGGDRVSISVPAKVHYKPGASNTLIAKGDPELLAQLTVKNGTIDMACKVRWRHRTLDITLPGREFRAYDIAGLTEIELTDLSQENLDVNVAGKSDITATGKVGNLKIQAVGNSDAHMKDLTVGRLSLTIMGKSEIQASPQENASITIMGRGDVDLYSEPKTISTTIMGSGNIRHLAKNS